MSHVRFTPGGERVVQLWYAAGCPPIEAELANARADALRDVQAILYTPGLTDAETVNRITALVDAALAAGQPNEETR